jgi:small subunit ribosomal protein S6
VRTYETLFIVNPDLEESDINKTVDLIQETITAGGGTLIKVDRWGKRQLAYQLRKKREGYYVLIYFEAMPTVITELQRRFKLTDTILRHVVLQLTKVQVEDLLHPPEPGKPKEFAVSPAFEDDSRRDRDDYVPGDAYQDSEVEED